MAFHRDLRVTGFAAVAGLLVAYARNALQYGRYSWDSVWEFLGWWFLHYVAVLLLIGATYVLTHGGPWLALARFNPHQKLTLVEEMIYGCTIVIVATIVIFLLAHWPVGLED